MDASRSTVPPLRVAIICGGPSAERGISLNSARSVLDHLQSDDIDVFPYYLDQSLQAYAISTAQMYSNTPSDFDFKLASTAQRFATHEEFLAHLRSTADIVWPVLHGRFGEDGGIQRLLESGGLPFVGTGAAAAAKAFDKYEAAQLLRAAGFATLPSFLVTDPVSAECGLAAWFNHNGVDRGQGRVVTKPACAGSSIGVSIAYGLADALIKCQRIISDGIDSRVVVELFASGGREFTAIVLDAPPPRNNSCSSANSEESEHVTLLPTEVELVLELDPDGNPTPGEIFSYRRKYLPTRQVGYYTPPRFPVETVTAIREGAAKLFKELGLRDFARVDGWLLPPRKEGGECNKHRQHADGSGRNSDRSGPDADGGGRKADGSGRSPDGNGRNSHGFGRKPDGIGQDTDGSERLFDGCGQYSEGIGRSLDGSGQSLDGSGRLLDESGRTETGQVANEERQNGAESVLDSDGSARDLGGFRRGLSASGIDSGGTIVFSDINLMSGMEQTSFLFQQAAEVGLAHADVLRTVLDTACARNGVRIARTRAGNSGNHQQAPHRTVKVLFGGSTSERQVSLMSGTNVWLKLRSFPDLLVEPFLLAPAEQTIDAEIEDREVWALPYASVLRHTVEEVVEGCEKALEPETMTRVSKLRGHVLAELHRAFSGAGCSTSEPAPQNPAVNPPRKPLANPSPNPDPVNPIKPLGSRTPLRSITPANPPTNLDPVKPTNPSESGTSLGSINPAKPRRLLLREWIREAKEENAVVFLAVHGGIGEDGTLQEMLESEGIPHTGSHAAASRTCMDKYATAQAIAHLRDQGIFSAAKRVFPTPELLQLLSKAEVTPLWETLLRELDCAHICVKPASDGCSTGVARLDQVADLTAYLSAVRDRRPRLSPGALSTCEGEVEMAVPPPPNFLFEPFIETDPILIRRTAQEPPSSGNIRLPERNTAEGGVGEVSISGTGSERGGDPQIVSKEKDAQVPPGTKLEWAGKSRWVEVTVGVLGPRGSMRALSPSVTVKESGHVLSLEEKFQGGTGVNLTPPPLEIVSSDALAACKKRIELVAAALGSEGFARIDAFLHVDTGEIIVIEANTVPGMTPSTVLFHQALAENPPMYPRAFFRQVVELALGAKTYKWG